MSQEELLDRIKNLDVLHIYDMSSDALAMLTSGFKEPLVRALMCRTQDNNKQKKIFTSIKRAYKNWKKDTDMFWGAMPYMEVYPDYMDKMQLDVECGMIVTEVGSIHVSPQKPFKAPYVPASAIQQYIAGTIVTETPDISKYKARIAELEAELKSRDERIAEKDAEITSLKKQLEECQNHPQVKGRQETENDEWVVELFSHYCYDDTQVAQSIIDEMRDKTDPEIADIILEKKTKNQISPKTQNRELWRILHAAKLYRGIEGNLNTALRRRQQQ